MLANYTAATFDVDAVVLPDYAHLDKPLIEVFTLDSDTCAACGYMRDAALRAVEELPDQADLVEYKFTKERKCSPDDEIGCEEPAQYLY